MITGNSLRMMLADITQHDVIWVVIILAVIALVLFILGRR